MISKRVRIGTSLFGDVLKKGKIFNSPSVLLKTIEIAGENNFSVVAQKSASKKAVDRNKLRRQGYYVIRKNRSNLKKGFASIFFIKKKISLRELESEMVLLLNKASLVK